MNSLISLRGRRVLWGTVISACLLSGFVLTAPRAKLLWRSAAVSHVTHLNPAASANPESRIPNRGSASAAQPRLVEFYGKLPLSFEINKGQTDSTVKFLARGSGYSLFLTGNEAVLALKKPGVRSQKPVGPAFGPTHRGSADLVPHAGSAAFPAWLRSRGLETNARTADPRTGSALHELALLPNAELFRDSFAGARIPNPEPRAPDAFLRMKLLYDQAHTAPQHIIQLAQAV
jgi:hypothetical protein